MSLAKEITLRLLLVAVLIAIIIGTVHFPALTNYFSGDSVVVGYEYTSLDEVSIKPVYDSSVPKGYILYIYSLEPTRTEYGYSYNNSDRAYEGHATGLFSSYTYTAHHTELVQAICVKIGSDPKTAYTDDKNHLDFDTMKDYPFSIEIECN